MVVLPEEQRVYAAFDEPPDWLAPLMIRPGAKRHVGVSAAYGVKQLTQRSQDSVYVSLHFFNHKLCQLNLSY